MSNLRSVTSAIQARVLAEFFQHGSVANRPAVDSGVLREALPAVTQKTSIDIRRPK